MILIGCACRERRNELQRQKFLLEQESLRLVDIENKKKLEEERQALLELEYKLTGGVRYEKVLNPKYVFPKDPYEETDDKVIVSE